MKKTISLIIFTTLAICLVTCKKFIEPDVYISPSGGDGNNLPVVETIGVTDITNMTAICSGKVIDGGGVTVIERGVCWSTEHNPTYDDNKASAGIGLGIYSCEITDLQYATTYYLKAYAINTYGTSYGEEIEFSTLPLTAAVTTKPITDIGVFGAKSGGIIIDDGGGTIVERGICWSISHDPTINDSHTTDGAGLGEFTSIMSGLQNQTVYYVRAYATNEVGTVYGNELDFITLDGHAIVSTNEINHISISSATCSGTVLDDMGIDVVERGICWSMSETPTVDDSHVSNGSGLGEFTSVLSELESNTTYYVRAYARNEAGTSYGNQLSFITEASYDYSVSETHKVHISRGNLQYQASTNTWRFAENQNSVIGDDNVNISSTYDGWIDLFGWGTGDNPTNISVSASDYSVFNDWGNNAISNGGDAGTWRTMTKEEWTYLLITRNTNSGIRFVKARVGGVKGLILLPDNWDSNSINLNCINNGEAEYTSNTISITNWKNRFEVNGAVFLPVTGSRSRITVTGVDTYGYYWSSTPASISGAYITQFSNSEMTYSNSYGREVGRAVRLVRDAN
ncbi:MAG: hypothetical protein J6T53_04450 [Bacteroidales bacterium]|nr:hypothetical protein [Bacteroidales bacterium]